MQIILYLISLFIIIYILFVVYKVMVEQYLNEENGKRKIKYLNEYYKATKSIDEKTKNLIYLDALKEIEIVKYSKLAEAYKNAKINMVVSDPQVIGDGFGAKQGASLGNFLKAVELVAGVSIDELAKKVTDKMEIK